MSWRRQRPARPRACRVPGMSPTSVLFVERDVHLNVGRNRLRLGPSSMSSATHVQYLNDTLTAGGAHIITGNNTGNNCNGLQRVLLVPASALHQGRGHAPRMDRGLGDVLRHLCPARRRRRVVRHPDRGRHAVRRHLAGWPILESNTDVERARGEDEAIGSSASSGISPIPRTTSPTRSPSARLRDSCVT